MVKLEKLIFNIPEMLMQFGIQVKLRKRIYGLLLKI